MIVCCPSCRTRYRFETDEPGQVAVGSCSRCEAAVPLVAPRRSYVLLPAAVRATRAVPAVAGAASLSAEAPPPSEWLPLEADGATTPDAAATQVVPVIGSSGTLQTVAGDASPGSHGTIDGQPSSGLSDPGLAPADLLMPPAPRPLEIAPATAPEPLGRTARRAGGRQSLLLAALLAIAGAAAGYYGTEYGWVEPVRLHESMQPMSLVVVGGLLGLLLGWAGLRWMASRS